MAFSRKWSAVVVLQDLSRPFFKTRDIVVVICRLVLKEAGFVQFYFTTMLLKNRLHKGP
jgi:hypothetical protein